MKLKLTVVDAEGARDVVVTADITATIAQLARRLSSAVPATEAVTLRAEFPGRRAARVLRPGATVHESGLRSGCRVEAIRVGSHRAGDDVDSAPTVVLRCVSGPQAGREFPLGPGVHVAGRSQSADLPLAGDHEVSRRHASIIVADTVQVVDLNSANGVLVDGERVQRAIITPESRLMIGASEFELEQLPAPARSADDWADDAFSRSPRVEPLHTGREFAFPDLPAAPEPRRFPYISLVAPIVLGAGTFFVSHQPTALLLVALSPVLALGSWLDQRTRGRRGVRADEERFDGEVAEIAGRLEAERTSESAARRRESPSLDDVVAAIAARSDLLWARKPEHPAFLTVRFGLGRLPSRSSLRAPRPVLGRAAELDRVEALVDDYSEVPGVPVIESLPRAGAIGVAGSTRQAAGIARSLVLQLVGLHSPADLVVTALAGGDTTAEWEWLKWLPHANSAYSPLEADGLAHDFRSGGALLSALEALVDARRTQRRQSVRSRLAGDGPLDLSRTPSVEALPALPAVLVIVTSQPPAERARLVELAEQGADNGVHVLWLAPAVSQLPSVCRTFVDAAGAGAATVGFVRNGREVELEAADAADGTVAATSARALAPIEDAGARVLDESDLPHDVAFLDLYDPELADQADAVWRRWAKNDSLVRAWAPGSPRESGGLRAVVGQGPTAPVALDLRSNGPHALVGGTTGSGKSEFLQTWIMGLAAEYAPDRLTFLLVDYKGGSAFAECVSLPHTVGLVTDLTPHLVLRALTSLRAELRHREELLNEKGAKDLVTLERRGDPDAPPALVIVIDEFAALVSDVPDFIDGVVDVAQRGRSLGIHLILATQRPSGVIRDNLRANTNLRVSLRVADEADSLDVLGVKDAAGFSPESPGRAAAKLGPGRLMHFQAAYLGGHTVSGGTGPGIEVEDLPFGSGRAWAAAVPPRPAAGGRDIERLAQSIALATAQQRLAAPRKPWLDPLPDAIDLSSLPVSAELSASGADAVALGIADEPALQRQTPFLLDLDEAGNVAVLGAGGSGKSTALRTVAVALSRSAATHPVEIYGLDFAGGALAPLEALPTVGAVIDGSDAERLVRLTRHLSDVLAERGRAFAAARASSLTEYRQLSGEAPPRIVVLVDGFEALRADYEFSRSAPVYDALLGIAASGRQAGIHLVAAAGRQNALPSSFSSAVGKRITLRLANEMEYQLAGIPVDALDGAPDGRALAGKTEVQLAVPSGSAELAVQVAAIDGLAAALASARVRAAEPVLRLPTEVAASALPAVVDGRPVIGLADDTLRPIGFPLDGLFVVSGPAGSGRTSAVATAIAGAAALRPSSELFLLASRATSLGSAARWAATSADDASAVQLAERLISTIDGGDATPIIVVENAGDFAGLPAEAAVARLLKAARRAGATVIAEADLITTPAAWQLFGELKATRAGLALQPEESDGLALYRVQFPRVARAEFPVGRGYLVESGRFRRVQVALRDAPSQTTPL